MASQQTIKAGKAFVELGVSDMTKKGLNSVQRSMNRFAGRMAAFSRRMAGMAALIGLPMLGAVKAFAAFEKQMAEVSTMLDKPGQHMKQFSAAVQGMSMRFGESTETLAKGLYQILSATIDASQALHVLNASAKAAIAGLSDTTTAADLITTVLNSYNMSASEATRISDILFATIKRGKTTFAELAQFLGKLTAVSAEVGVAFEEVTATIALLTRNGVQTEVAVTAIRQALASLLKPAKQSADEFERIFGMAMSPEAIEQMGGLPGFLKKLSERSGKEIAKMFPNVRALMGILPAASNNAELQKDVKEMQNSAGATEEAYQKMANTLSFQLDRLKKSFIVFLQTLGEAFMPEIKDGIDAFNGIAASAIAWVKTQKPLIMMVGKLVLGLIGLSVASFAVAKAIGVISIAMTALLVICKAVLFTFGLLISFPKIAIAAFVVLAAGIASAGKQLENFQEFSIDIWTAMKKNAQTAVSGIVSALKAGNLDLAMEILIAGLEVLWEDFWFWLKDGFLSTFDGIIKAFQQAGTGIAMMTLDLERKWNDKFGPEPPNMDRNSTAWKNWKQLFEENNPEKFAEMQKRSTRTGAVGWGAGARFINQDVLDDLLFDEYVKGYKEKVKPLRESQFMQQSAMLGNQWNQISDPEQRRIKQINRRNAHTEKMKALEAKLQERVNQAKAEAAAADERYSKAQNDIAADMKAKQEAMDVGEVGIPEIDGMEDGGVRSRGLLRGLTGAFNTTAAMRVAMSAMLPPVVGIDERNANANERSADILQKIDRKLAGVGLAE